MLCGYAPHASLDGALAEHQHRAPGRSERGSGRRDARCAVQAVQPRRPLAARGENSVGAGPSRRNNVPPQEPAAVAAVRKQSSGGLKCLSDSVAEPWERCDLLAARPQTALVHWLPDDRHHSRHVRRTLGCACTAPAVRFADRLIPDPSCSTAMHTMHVLTDRARRGTSWLLPVPKSHGRCPRSCAARAERSLAKRRRQKHMLHDAYSISE